MDTLTTFKRKRLLENIMKGVKGLTSSNAKKLILKFGYNEITELTSISPAKILLRQIRNNFVLYLLLAAGIISVFVEKLITGYTIFGIIIVLILVGFFQEYKAERSIKALKQMIMPVSIAIRDGKETEVPSKELVPGDTVILRAGEKVPADMEIIQEKDLKVNEAILTGESAEIKKSSSGPDNQCKLFMGTMVISGKCYAQVEKTGLSTEFGKIASMISKSEKAQPLNDKVNLIAKYMVVASVFFSVLTGFFYLLRHWNVSNDVIAETLIVVIALSVSAFPEGFPIVLISTLAAGAMKMAGKNAIVNRLSIIETLGETTVICSDKTGTITKGEMTAEKIFVDGSLLQVSGAGYEGTGQITKNGKTVKLAEGTSLDLLLKCAVLCNDSVIERKGIDSTYNIRGSPTEASLKVMAAKANIFSEDQAFKREEEVLFSSERKMMTVLCRNKKESIVFAKGSLETLIKKCKRLAIGTKTITMQESDKKKILKISKSLSRNLFRIIAFAYKKHSLKKDLECDLVFLGFVCLNDPPREEVKAAVKACLDAGIKVKMITGDSKETAKVVAIKIGLNGDAMTGEEIDLLDDNALSRKIRKVTVFARVRPEHKLRIVKALKKNNEIVTMTGDGVNDAPALKDAHIGIAMGKNGTDASREASDIVLKDDNFATIVEAIKEGRTILNNVKKFVTYQISCNCAEIFVIFLGVVLGLPLPLLAAQILFMNLVTDNLPALTLGFNPPSLDVLRKKPKKQSLVSKEQIYLIAIAAIVMGTATLGIFFYSLNILHLSIEHARTNALLTLILLEIANAFNFRSFRYPVHKLPINANKSLIYASLISIGLTFLVLYVPFLNRIFETVPIPAFSWGLAFLFSLSIVAVFEIVKMARIIEVN